MQTIELTGALEILRTVTRDHFARTGTPIPGARLKPAVIRAAQTQGMGFHEKFLGFHSFLDFVASCKELSVQLRPGSDFLVMPLEKKDYLPTKTITTGRGRVRQDIWLAFMTFPQPGIRRVYNHETDQVLYQPDTSSSESNPVILPFTREQQLAWRREFLGQLEPGMNTSLQSALQAPNPFREFAIAIKRQTLLYPKWNFFLWGKARPVIEAWAEQHSIPLEKWLPLNAESNDRLRKTLYKMLDNIPFEELIAIRVPLSWLLTKQ